MLRKLDFTLAICRNPYVLIFYCCITKNPTNSNSLAFVHLVFLFVGLRYFSLFLRSNCYTRKCHRVDPYDKFSQVPSGPFQYVPSSFTSRKSSWIVLFSDPSYIYCFFFAFLTTINYFLPNPFCFFILFSFS